MADRAKSSSNFFYQGEKVMNWYLAVLKNYAGFEGRAHRTEYWMFALVNFLISLALAFISEMLHMGDWLSILYSLAVLIPCVAVTVRRLHDTGRTGWMALIALIPIIGGIWLLVLMCLDSQPGANQYGSNPKENI